jgi:phage terminase Nu1 subunit (DNA packaging protein)
MIVNKREMAALLGCTLPTLDKWLQAWPDFPIVERGRNGQLWQFDAEAACAFVKAKHDAARAEKDRRTAALAQLALPLPGDDGVPGVGGARSAAEMLTMARLRRIQREEEIACGRLVEARRVGAALADVFGRLGRGLRSGLRQVMAAHGVPPDCAAAIEAAFAAQQREAVERISAELGQTIEAPDDQGRAPLRLVAG